MVNIEIQNLCKIEKKMCVNAANLTCSKVIFWKKKMKHKHKSKRW